MLLTEAAPVRSVGPQTISPRFTGRGDEYFRIWVVNLLLTVLTAGLYSPWAKVRKAKYFRQNTWLDGHVFDYHGDPRAILRGRILALGLVTAYTWGFQFSTTAGLLAAGILCALGPWLFMRAQRFTLANTSHRGLRFGFRGGLLTAYATVLPPLVLWLAPGVAQVVGAGLDGPAQLYLTLGPLALFVVALPWMHHRLKAYQRRHATYGDQAFAFRGAALGFYWVYFKGVLLVIAAGLLVSFGSVALFAARHRAALSGKTLTVEFMIHGALSALLMYVLVWPYCAARLQQVVWSRTRLGQIRFRTEIRARTLARIVLRNTLLTLATVGLYWPWAAVALARYRIECVRVEADVPLSTFAAGLRASPGSAAGDAAVEAFGFDLGL